ncbi:MAG TPA: endonuclease/exonuclease/phosphatase family protein [Elusimicrobiota bacterium]|nr:endonuclease/exonuclease/phosphatase family protein [Elusimicrobiota bacterium]
MSDQPSLSVLQWNVGNFDVGLRLPGRGAHGMAYTNGTPSRDEDLAGFAAVIRALEPDFVTLQEVVVGKGHHRRLAELSGYALADHGPAEERHTQALLVRRASAKLLETVKAPGVRLVGARVRLADGRELSVLSTHSEAGIRTAERVAQHRALAAWARERRGAGPCVIGGDFNFDDTPGNLLHGAERMRQAVPFFPRVATTDWKADSEALAGLKESLSDLAARSGPTAGAPRLWPRILLPFAFPLIPVGWALGVGRRRARLDYVFGSGVDAVESRVLSLSGPAATGHPAAAPGAFPWMDHNPVLVRFRLAGQ